MPYKYKQSLLKIIRLYLLKRKRKCIKLALGTFQKPIAQSSKRNVGAKMKEDLLYYSYLKRFNSMRLF